MDTYIVFEGVYLAERLCSPLFWYITLNKYEYSVEQEDGYSAHLIDCSYSTTWVIAGPIVIPEGTFTIQVYLRELGRRRERKGANLKVLEEGSLNEELEVGKQIVINTFNCFKVTERSFYRSCGLKRVRE